MTTLTGPQWEALETAATDVIAHCKVVLGSGQTRNRDGATDRIVAVRLLQRAIEKNPLIGSLPHIAATWHECHGPGCHNLTDTPIRDEYAVFWIGDLAATYCSQDCESNAAEAESDRRREMVGQPYRDDCPTYDLNTGRWVR